MGPSLSPDDLDTLFDLAETSISAGLGGARRPSSVDVDALPPALRELRAAFVTVEVDGALNGCIGTMEADEPLGAAVSRLAFESAFGDPRLPAIRADEWPRTRLKVSVLSARTPIDVASEDELLADLRPGVDGLVLALGRRRATFLPAVWEKVPDPADFVRQLQHKAGIPVGVWLPGTQVWRYTADEYARQVGDRHAVKVA